MTVLATVNFTGADNSTPAGFTVQNGAITILSNQGSFKPTNVSYSPSNAAYTGIAARADMDVKITFTVPNGEAYIAVTARSQMNPSGYYPDGYSMNMQPGGAYALNWVKAGSNPVNLGYGPYNATAGFTYTARLRTVGSTIQSKLWLTSGTEPTLWDITVADTNVTAAGYAGMQMVDGATALPVVIDDLIIDDGAAPARIRRSSGIAAHGAPFAAVPASQAAPSGPVLSNGRTFNPVVVQDFNTPAALGSVRSVYSNMGYFTAGQKDTSNYGRYDADKVLSVHDGMLDFYLHTETPTAEAQANGAPSTPTPLVACVMPDNYTPILYGRAAVRYKVEATVGVGYKFVPMFWPTSDIWNDGEIDFIEFDIKPGARARPANATPGTVGQAGNGGPIFRPDGDMFAPTNAFDWHVGAVEWTPEGIFFYHDGVLQAVIEASRVPTKPMRMELQGETFIAQGLPATNAVAHIYVDWVATYQMAGYGLGSYGTGYYGN